MRKVLIICGTGIATSTVVRVKIEKRLCKMRLENKVKLYQSKMSDEIDRLDEYDIILSTIIVPDRIKENVIDGIPLLTGMNEDEVYQKILEKVNQKVRSEERRVGKE